MLKTQTLTANEAAAASRIPLKQVHRIIDAGLLEGALEREGGSRMIGAPGLMALKLAYVTADALKPEARRRAVLRLIARPDEPAVRDGPVTVETGPMEAELREGLKELAEAKAMVASDPEIMGGTPCFVGTRIPVHDVADMLTNGDTVSGLLRAYPVLDERRLRLSPIYAAAYPRRGRPKRSPLPASSLIYSKTLRLEDLPTA